VTARAARTLPHKGPRPKRRSQEERSSETRARLLDATLASLIERGYAATSTPEVCRRAKLSRGAMLHHFPTREELVISSVAHLATRRAAEIRARASALANRREPLDAVLELMWSAYDGPLFHAALELWVAARSDRALHRALYPVERTLGRGMRELWADVLQLSLGPDPARQQKLDDLVALTQHLLRGMAVQRILKPDDAQRRRLFDAWKSLARASLDGTAPVRP
jgi:AcrR family transcriptional regulator